MVPRSVLEAARDAKDGGGDWPGVGEVSAELIATMPCAHWLAKLDADVDAAGWLVRGIVVTDATAPTGRLVVGHVGGHGRPDADGRVEAGYTLAVAARGVGLATEAVRAWFEWAHRQGARIARLSIAEGNEASLALAERLGLTAVDRMWDEPDQVWETVLEGTLPLP